MYKSPSRLPEEARQKLIDALNARLADGLDLWTQIKVAHWTSRVPISPACTRSSRRSP